MKTLRKTLLIGLAVLSMGAGTALSAHADEGRHGAAARQEKMQAHMAEMFTHRMAMLHDKLKLSAAQEGAWTTYVAAITPAAGAMQHPDRAAIAAMPAPDRLEHALTATRTHITTMEGHLAALKTFYAVLTPEQKKVFDDNVMGGAHGPSHMGMMMHH
ncbi:MAG: Spy/CpxP family protein refolding chaperone [Pseudomonadota bacterium]